MEDHAWIAPYAVTTVQAAQSDRHTLVVYLPAEQVLHDGSLVDALIDVVCDKLDHLTLELRVHDRWQGIRL